MKAIAMFAVVVGLVSTISIAAPGKPKLPKAPYTQIYFIGDLPIWRADLKK